MTITQKIAALMQDRRQKVIAERIGVHPITLSSYTKGTIPGADVAAKLARALGVDPGWLIDDLRGWPPARVETSAPTIPQPKAA
jgi:transcriptional regulator with XRE-family HTH domain